MQVEGEEMAEMVGRTRIPGDNEEYVCICVCGTRKVGEKGE